MEFAPLPESEYAADDGGTIAEVDVVDSAPGTPISGTPASVVTASPITPSTLGRAQSWRPSELMQSSPPANSIKMKKNALGAREGRPPLGRARGPGSPFFTAIDADVDQSSPTTRSRAGTGTADNSDAEHDPLTEEETLLAMLVERETAARQHVGQAYMTLLTSMERRFLAGRHDLQIEARRRAVLASRAGVARPDGPGGAVDASALAKAAVDADLVRACPWKTPLAGLRGILKGKRGGRGASIAATSMNSSRNTESGTAWNVLRSGGVRQRLKAMRMVVDEPQNAEQQPSSSQAPELEAASVRTALPRKVRFSKTLRIVPIPPRDGVVDIEVDIAAYGLHGGPTGGGGAPGFVPYERALTDSDDTGSGSDGDENSSEDGDGASESTRMASNGSKRSSKRGVTKPVGFQDRAGKRLKQKQQRLAKDAPLRPLMPNEAQMLQNALANSGAESPTSGADVRGMGALMSVLDSLVGDDLDDKSEPSSPLGSPGVAANATQMTSQRPSGEKSSPRNDTRAFGIKSMRDAVVAVMSSSASARGGLGEFERQTASAEVCFGRSQSMRPAMIVPKTDLVSDRLRREADDMLAHAPRNALPDGYRDDTQYYDKEMAWLAATRAKRATRSAAPVKAITASAPRRPAEPPSSPAASPRGHVAPLEPRRIASLPPTLEPPVYLRRRKDCGAASSSPLLGETRLNPLLEATMREAEEEAIATAAGIPARPPSVSALIGASLDDEGDDVPMSRGVTPDRNSLLEAGDDYVWQTEAPKPPRVWRAFINPAGADKRRIETEDRNTPAGARWRAQGYTNAKATPVRLTPATLARGVRSSSESDARAAAVGREASPDHMVSVLTEMDRSALRRNPGTTASLRASTFTGIALPTLPASGKISNSRPAGTSEADEESRRRAIEKAVMRLTSLTPDSTIPAVQSSPVRHVATARHHHPIATSPKHASNECPKTAEQLADVQRRRLLRQLEQQLARCEASESPELAGRPGGTSPLSDQCSVPQSSGAQPKQPRAKPRSLGKSQVEAREALVSMQLGRELLRQRCPPKRSGGGAASARVAPTGSRRSHLLSRDDVESDPAYRRGAAVIFGYSTRDEQARS